MLKLIRFLMEWLANALRQADNNADYAIKLMEEVIDECIEAEEEERSIRTYTSTMVKDREQRDAWSDRQCSMLEVMRQSFLTQEPGVHTANELVLLVREFQLMERRRCSNIMDRLWHCVKDNGGVNSVVDRIEAAISEVDVQSASGLPTG